jgi:NTP pyrophosphatase (non-canonical NTP hydrolase)
VSDLSFDDLRRANVDRCEDAYHPLDRWSLTDWACAAAGEMGEACGVVKRLRRITEDTDLACIDNPDLVEHLAEEIADTVIYLDLLAARAGIDLADAVRSKFNRTSGQVCSDVTL